jgi:hypothetical protein
MALLGGVASFLTGHLRLVILLIAVAAVFFGFWIQKKHWKKIGIGLMAIATLTAAGALTSVLVPALSPASSENATGASSSPSGASVASNDQSNSFGSTPTRSTSFSPPVSPKAKLSFSGEVTLPRHAAVDVDEPDQPVVADQSGVTGAFDLFHDSGAVRSDTIRTHDGVRSYPSGKSSEAAYDVCLDYTSPNPSYNSYNPSAGVSIGETFCFTTSDHRVAWARVESVQPDNFTAVLEVRVWDKLVRNN